MPRFIFTPQTFDQTAILQDGFLTDSSRSGTLILPTGGGKTQLARVAILYALSQSKKAVYLSPTKVVLDEQYRNWQTEINELIAADQPQPAAVPEVPELSLFDMIEPDEPQVVVDGSDGVGDGGEVGNSDGDGYGDGHGDDDDQSSRGAGSHPSSGDAGSEWLAYTVDLKQPPTVGIFDGDHPAAVGDYQRTDLLLMTPERLDLCLRHPGVQKPQSWIKSVAVCVIDEVQILRDGHRGARLEGALTRLRLANPDCRWVALSADLDPEDRALLDWIGGYVYCSTVRPVPQVWQLVNYRNGAEQDRKLLRLLQQTGYLSLVFVNSRNRTARVVRALSRSGIEAEIHHAGRSSEQRQHAEMRFRNREIQVLVATSTLATGVNLPARQVVIYDLYKFNGRAMAAGATAWADRVMPLSLQEVLQMAGRAGRPGLDPQGDVVIMAHERDAWAQGLLPRPGLQDGSERPLIQSVLCTRTAWLIEQVLALISGGYAGSIQQVQDWFNATLAGRQAQLPDGERLAEMLVTLRRAGLLVPEASPIAATPLGQVCSTQYLMPAVTVRWSLSLQQIAAQQEQPTFLDWLALVNLSPETRLLGGGASPLFEVAESRWLSAGVALARLHCQDQVERVEAIYTHAAILKQFTRSEGSLDQVLDWVAATAGGYLLYGADLQAALDDAIRLVEALIEVSALVKDKAGSGSDAVGTAVGKLQVLAQMLKTGLSGEAVSLTLLNGIGVKRALALSAIGICRLDQVAKAEAEAISAIKGISDEHAVKLIEQARSLQKVVKPEWFRD